MFSDCLSAIQEISKPVPMNKVVCDIRHTLINIQHQGSTVFFEWIPSHSGIPGNEKVDTIAKLGTQKPKKQLSSIGIKPSLKLTKKSTASLSHPSHLSIGDESAPKK